MTQIERRQADPRDVFISYKTEDRDMARRIAEALVRLGWSVWFDEFELKLGDSLTKCLNRGLAQSTVGLIVVGPAYLALTGWASQEFAALLNRQVMGESKALLVARHGVTQEGIVARIPMLADVVAANTAEGPEAVARAASAALEALGAGRSSAQAVAQARESRARGLATIVGDVMQIPSRRRRAARELGQIRGSVACDVLIAHLRSDPDERVREAAASGLGRLGEARARDSLVATINDPSERIRLSVAVALQRLGQREAVRPLCSLATSASNYGYREAAVIALRDMQVPEALDALSSSVSSEAGPVRHRAAEGLAALGDPRAIDSLIAQLRVEQDEHVWGGIVWALAQLRAQTAIPVFIDVLSDPRAPINKRRQMAYALGLVGGDDACSALRQTLNADDHGIRTESIWALMEARDLGAIPALDEMLETADQHERETLRWATEYLSQERDPDDIDGDEPTRVY